MKNFSTQLLFICLLLSFVCCTAQKKESETLANDTVTESVTVIKVPEDVQKGAANTINSIIESIDLIPLQTLPEALLRDPRKVVMAEYIYYMSRQGLWIIDRKGKFKKQLPNGKGPGELTQALDFQIAPNGDLLVLEYLNIQRYTAQGEFISDSDIVPEGPADLGAGAFAWFGEDNYYLWEEGGRHLERTADKTHYHLHRVGENRSLQESSLEIFSMTMSIDRFVFSNSGYYLSPSMYENRIRKVSESGVTDEYLIDFGNGNVNLNNLQQGFSREINFSNFDKLKQSVRGIANFMDLGDYLYFQFVSKGGYQYTFVDKSSAEVYSASNKNAFIDELLPFRVITYDRNENEVIAMMQPGSLFEHLSEQGLELKQTPLIDAEDLKMLSSLEPSDNPVLIRLTLK